MRKFEYFAGIFTGERRSVVAKPQTSGDSAIIRPELNDLLHHYYSILFYLFSFDIIYSIDKETYQQNKLPIFYSNESGVK